MAARRAHHLCNVRGRKRRRRSAPEIERRDFPALTPRLNPPVRPERKFTGKALRIAGRGRLGKRVLIEHAVKAPGAAERHLDIGDRLRRARLVRKRLKLGARGAPHHRESDRTGMHRRLGAEGRVERIAHVGMVGLVALAADEALERRHARLKRKLHFCGSFSRNDAPICRPSDNHRVRKGAL